MYKTTDEEFNNQLYEKLITPYSCNYWKQSRDATCNFTDFKSQEQQKFVATYFTIMFFVTYN